MLNLCFSSLVLPVEAQNGGCYGYGTGNTEEAHDVIQMSNGDIVVAGETNQNNIDAYLVRFTPGSQQVKWAKAYNNANSKKDVAKALVKHSNGDIYMAGVTKTSGNQDILVARIDPSDGSIKADKHIGTSNPDVANDIIETRDGDLAITGQSKTNSGGTELTYVLEFTLSNSTLSVQREFATGTGRSNVGSALVQDSQGDFWVGGEDENNSGSGLIYQLKEQFSNKNTNDIKYRALVNGGSSGQTLKAIGAEGGSVIAAGSGKFTKTGKQGAFAITFDETTTANGSNVSNAVQNFKQYTSGSKNRIFGITDNSNGYTFTGENTNSNKLLTFQVTTSLGTINWNQVMGGSSTDFGNSVIELSDGTFLNAGKSGSGDFRGNGAHFFLTNVTSGGVCCCGSSRNFTVRNLTTSGTVNGDGNLTNSSFKTASSNLSSNISSINLNASSLTGSFTSGGSNCGALPVEFMGFRLTKVSTDQVKVTWETATETKNDYFSILRAHGGESFQSIGRREGQGTKLSSTSYSFLDDNLNPGTYYYKIKQTDFDGSTSTSKVKAIQIDHSQANKLTIESVSVQNGMLKAELKGVSKASYQAQLYNSKGQPVAMHCFKPGEGKQTLSFSAEYRSAQILYLRIWNKRTGATVATKKVLATP